MNEIFGPTVATAEKAGDVIEFWLGLLDIAAMTKGVVNIFDDDIDPTKYLNGPEAAVRLCGKVARTTSTINTKRKGSFDCSLDARESDEVMTRINQVDLYRKPNYFNYLTDDEAKVVMELLRDITQTRVPMDTSSSANPDTASGSPNQQVEGGPQGGEQSSQAADESISGRQMVLEALGALYSTAEEANLCLYCGSTEHEHFDCKNPGKDAIKNALSVIRGCMQEETTEAEADRSTVDPSGSGHNVDADAQVDEEISDDEDDPAEGQMYDKPIYMSEVGDRDELGRFCIAGRKVDEGGPTTRDQIDEVVREALMRGTRYRWSMDSCRILSELFRHRMYEEIKHYMNPEHPILISINIFLWKNIDIDFSKNIDNINILDIDFLG